MYEVDQYTVSLLHFDDGIKDETGKVWTANGGAAVSSAQSKFGGSSLYLSGTSQYLTTPNSAHFDFGGNDFTVDWWEYRTSVSYGECVYNRDIATTSYAAIKVGHPDINGKQILVGMSSTGNNADIATNSMGDAILNAWTHYAVVRNGNNFYTFQNGILQSSWSSTLAIASCPNAPTIGKNNTLYFHGYIDEFRISNIARWTSGFDPELPQPPTGHGLLRITMNDSSEREYRLSTAEIEKFIKWYDRTVGTGNTCYVFDDIIDSSKEYLSFDKIISFKVIPLNK